MVEAAPNGGPHGKTDSLVEYSRLLIERGSKSFAGAAKLFTPPVRASAYMLYAWCRHCDDEIDGQELGFASARPDTRSPQARLDELKHKTLRAMRGDASEPIFQALQRVVAEHRIPRRHPLELLDGMAMDVDGRAYREIDDTLSYSYHVAGVVGVMMAMIMGVRDAATLHRASDLGIAFQLTNIARDVIPDARAGRVYLPGAWLADAGVEAAPASVAEPVNRPAVSQVTRRLLDTADVYYASAGHGLSHLPFRSAWAIAAARRIYRDIGAVVRAKGDQAWDERATVSRGRKLAGVALGAIAAANARTLGRLTEAPARPNLWTKPDLGDGSGQ